MSSSSPYKVRICQVEETRNDDASTGYYPDVSQFPGVTFIDGCPKLHKSVSNVSSHATAVTQILLGGPAAGLVASIVVCELFEFIGPARPLDSTIDQNPYGLNGGRTLEPSASAWDIENISAGETTQVWDESAITQETKRIERDNILAFGGLPDPGMPAYLIMGATQSRNFVRVGSSVTGQVTNARLTYDVLGAVWSTSYSTPTVAQTGVAMVSWLKTNGITYNAGDLGDIIRAAAKANGMNHDHSASMNALYAKYGSPVTPVPTPPANTTTSTPAQTPVSTTTNSTAPIVTKFTGSNAWSDSATPTTVTWAGTGVSAILTDAAGVSMPVSPSGSMVIDTLESNGSTWTLVQIAADGTKSDPRPIILHGKFNAAQKAQASSPTTVTPLPPTPDQKCTTIATTLGLTYANGSFSGVTPAKVAPLSAALQQASLV